MNEFLKDSSKTKQKQKYFKRNILSIFKVIIIIFFFSTNNKLNDREGIKKFLYSLIDINIYKQTIELNDGGELEIFKNPKKEVKIETKTGTIFKSDIVFLIIPGGSYWKLGVPEQEPVAKKFFSLGYSSAILKYSVYPKCYPTNYQQGITSLEVLSLQFSKTIILGFSAGGHLAGLLGTTDRKKIYNAVGMILCYPVISFVEKVHEYSRNNFFGNVTENNEKNQKLFSIDYRVNNNTLPTFIWTIKNDKKVPYENTLFMIKKLKENNVTFDYKIYENGIHGMALADETAIRKGIKEYKNDEVAKWVGLACNFSEKIIKNN